ncbi:MAG: reverse transcriptase family protein, partial [Pseudomonadota bacterium]
SFLDQIWLDEQLSRHYEDTATIGPPIGNSDHSCVLLAPAELNDSSESRTVSVWDYRESNLVNFNDCLSNMDFSSLNEASNVDEMCDHFYEMFYSAMSLVPSAVVTMSNSDKPWMTPVLKLLINRRWEAFRHRDWKLFLHYKKKTKEEITKAKMSWAKKNCESNKNIWNIVNQTRNKNCDKNMSNLKCLFGDLHGLLNELSHQFSTNFNHTLDVPLLPIQNSTLNLHITENDVFKKLAQLKVKKSTGLDGVAPKLLKAGALYLSFPISCIFNRSIKERTFPSHFKIAKVCPVPKKTKPAISDFRPISVLSSLSKVFEQLVLDQVKVSLIQLYGARQHAFRPLGSTTSALIDIVEAVSSNLDSRECLAVHLSCIDLTKAFDKMHHNRLLNFLNSNGIDHGFLLWLKSYLSERCQYVMLDGVTGPPLTVCSGVPQGSVLGPYLFAAFFGMLISTFTCKNGSEFVLYADDLTVIEPVTKNFTSSVQSIVSRITENGLDVNSTKCKSLCITRSPYHLCTNLPFDLTENVKILGFIFNNKFSWDDQVSSVVTRASRRLFIIRTLKKFMCNKELKIVYHALITSLIMYASPVYGRLHAYLLNKLERFQKRAHRLICGSDCPCSDFEPIETRLNRACISFLLKCEGSEKHPLHVFVPQRAQRTGFLLLPYSRTEKRLRTFLPHA